MIQASRRHFWEAWEAPTLPFGKASQITGLLKPSAPHFSEEKYAGRP